jgi:hypothetical protein
LAIWLDPALTSSRVRSSCCRCRRRPTPACRQRPPTDEKRGTHLGAGWWAHHLPGPSCRRRFLTVASSSSSSSRDSRLDARRLMTASLWSSESAAASLWWPLWCRAGRNRSVPVTRVGTTHLDRRTPAHRASMLRWVTWPQHPNLDDATLRTATSRRPNWDVMIT